MREEVVQYLKDLQDRICAALELSDGQSTFHQDQWEHVSGGGGRTRVIAEGAVFEKGGVNFSAVEGAIPSFLKDNVNKDSSIFFASGVSLVLHPINPNVPIVHMNIRYFETDGGDCWFGGGIDLTPIYVNTEQASNFHRTLKDTCDSFDPKFYDAFKKWADDYFFIPHRNETRGVGGIFYDYLKPEDTHSQSDLFKWMRAVGDAFIEAYVPIVEANKSLPYTEQQKHWQLIRRGRYVEFNLVYDRGTRFGLETGGRIESILMSLPKHASWEYNFLPELGSEESKTLAFLAKGIDWTK